MAIPASLRSVAPPWTASGGLHPAPSRSRHGPQDRCGAVGANPGVALARVGSFADTLGACGLPLHPRGPVAWSVEEEKHALVLRFLLAADGHRGSLGSLRV